LVQRHGSTLYVTGPGGLPLEQVSGTTVLYYQQDQLGSTRAITDSAGAIAASYTYDAYGNLTSQTGSVSNPFLYTGQYRDSETGLYYLRARYYDPATAQFLSRDPKRGSTWTPYSYVAGNPLNLSDPSGLDFLGDLFGAIGGVFDAFNSFSNGVAAAYGNFTASVSVVCPPAGHFLNGLASGFNLDMQESNDPWFKAGQIVGMGLFIATLMTGPEDLLADAAAVRVVSKLPEAAKLAEKVPDAANIVYRGGTRTLDALTPATKDLAWEAGGLRARSIHFPQRGRRVRQ
jgi:RHS repeat-associated protein